VPLAANTLGEAISVADAVNKSDRRLFRAVFMLLFCLLFGFYYAQNSLAPCFNVVTAHRLHQSFIVPACPSVSDDTRRTGQFDFPTDLRADGSNPGPAVMSDKHQTIRRAPGSIAELEM
jgi:hypothetical protein